MEENLPKLNNDKGESFKVNEYGEIIRGENTGSKEGYPSALEITIKYDAARNGNILPPGYEFTEGAKSYYKPHHIAEIKEIREEIKQIAKNNGVTNLMNWDGSEGISVKEALDQIEKNLAFSEKFNANLNK